MTSRLANLAAVDHHVVFIGDAVDPAISLRVSG
jgi:hypothetical protein